MDNNQTGGSEKNVGQDKLQPQSQAIFTEGMQTPQEGVAQTATQQVAAEVAPNQTIQPQPQTQQSTQGPLPAQPLQSDLPQPSEIPESKAVVITPKPEVNKRRVVLLVVIGVVLLALAGGGGYYYYSQNIEGQETDQSLTTLPSPITLPTRTPQPTLVPTISVPESEETGVSVRLGYCENFGEEATASAIIDSYCQGDICAVALTKEECDDIDVVATEGGVLSKERIEDGIGDCIWDEASGFNQCKPFY